MMDSEIDLPIYADTLERLAGRIADLSGPVIDTSCGSGHMLSRYHARYDPQRPLIGIDLSPGMIEIARSRLVTNAELITGDTRDLGTIEPHSAAAVLSFFAIHHIEPPGIAAALREWHRVLEPGGQLVIAAWEGTGPIGYGDQSDVVALRYRDKEIVAWAESTDFTVERCIVEPVEGMPMQAVYLEGTTK